jgi:hypothetical protein
MSNDVLIKESENTTMINQGDSHTKKCPFCAELIQVEALVCRYCKSDLSTAQINQSDTSTTKSKIQIDKSRTAEFVLGLIGGCIGIICSIIAMFIGSVGQALEASGASTISNLGVAALLFSITGIVGGTIARSNGKLGSTLLIVSSICGIISISFFYILPGILLFIGGIVGIIKPIQTNKKARWIIWIPAIALIVALIFTISGSGKNNSSGDKKASVNKGNSIETDVTAKIGDVIKTDKFEVVISKVETRNIVGSKYFEKNPSSGGIYVAVQWQYKNISQKPIGTFSMPSLEMVDKSNTKYDADIGASSSFATELNLDRKILSDLNPGIMVKDAEVYEVSKELYEKGGWRLHLKCDKDIYININ